LMLWWNRHLVRL